MHGVQDGVRDWQLAVTTPRTLAVKIGKHVGRATHAAVVNMVVKAWTKRGQ